jgi:hypothetical protein
MANDTKYTPVEMVYRSRGLLARDTLDEAPVDTYLQSMNTLERAENSLSSRYGYQIINRDPAGTTTGYNYFFKHPVVSLAKMNYAGFPQRFAGLSDGDLFQRNSNSQGPYTKLPLPLTAQGQQIRLSGQPWDSCIAACYETSLPFLFIADEAASIKVAAGASNPQLWGIDPSPYTLNVNPYAPLLIMIEPFSASDILGTSNISGWAWGNIETLDANSGQLITDFSQFFGITPSGGGSSNYNPSPTSTSVSASQSGVGETINDSSTLDSFPGVVPSYGETVSLTVVWNAVINVSGGTGGGNGAGNIQYSPDGGVTWINFAGISSGSNESTPNIPSNSQIGVSNLNLLQIRAQAIAVVGDGGISISATINIINAYATVTNAGAFGPIVNGMVALLNGNGQNTVPISSVTSVNEIAGVYTQLQVNTTTNHDLSASNAMAIYASSSDLVDGFYEVASVTASNSFLIPFLSATQIGATGGYVTYASTPGSASNYAGNPPYCVLSDQYSNPYPSQMSAWGFYEWVPPTTSVFPISAWAGTVNASTVGSVQKTVTLDLNQNNQVTDDDLICLTFLTSAPANIAQVELRFFVGNGQNNYYTAFISPAYFQGAVAGTTLAYQATQQQILADALNLITGQPPGTTTAQLQPSNISTGAGSWAACLIPRGNFLPVGQAGQAGADWDNITGWELLVTTNANGSASFSVNGLYLQWGYGPSSFAGVGYDWRQTYYNANTGTESSPTPIQTYNEDFGYLASTSAPIYLRQAAQVVGRYSNDPQDTHVRIYRRGGILASNWVQVIQAPNVTGGGYFTLKDVIADQFVLEAPPLVLDNDPPVTSSLVTPIQTTLALATTGPGSSIYSTFSPQTVTVAQANAVFVPNMIVQIGNANNLEGVMVITGGTGTFTAILRLQHNMGEPVNVYAIPRQACNLCCIANLPGGAIQVLLAGDENNPARVYFSKPGQPENFGPENYLDSPTPNDPVVALINWRGTALVATQATWYIFVGGAQPYLQPTGATHGIVASQGWTIAEGVIPFRAADGWRFFSGADGKYMTLPVEWIFRTNPFCLPPQASASDAYQDVFAYYNNFVLGSYISLSGERYRLIFDTSYNRYRNDDIAATAMLWERDTNQLVMGIPVLTASNTIGYAVALDQQYGQDYDDGGWNTASNSLVQFPIQLDIQTPYRDLGKPHFPKQWNVLETDVNTEGQNMNTTLWFDSGESAEIVLPTQNAGTQRQKIQQQINGGEGNQSYSMSIQHTMGVTVAPTFYQENVYAALLADYRSSWDSYWQKFGIDLLKLVKEAYFDYSATAPVVINLYVDGSSIPYYTTTLTVQPTRLSVRLLFPAVKCRLWRIVLASTGNFQLWTSLTVCQKPLQEGSGYAEHEFVVAP